MSEQVSERLRRLAEALEEEVKVAISYEAEITTLRDYVIEITVNMRDSNFDYESLRKLERIAREHGCGMEFFAGAEDNDLILLVYFYPSEEVEREGSD